MSIFDTIKNAIFGHHGAAAAPAPSSNAVAPANAAPAPATAPAAAAPSSGISQAELETKLAAMAASSGQKLNWQSSIVDLMKLVALDPSLANRKTLAHELGYTGDTNDSATMNIWLHKAVMQKLAAGGGQVPSSLKT